MKVLVLNSGSSSIKYKMFDVKEYEVVASGLLECIGETESRLVHHWLDDAGVEQTLDLRRSVVNHADGFSWVVEVNNETKTLKDPKELMGIGHRVVHGGEKFSAPTLVTAEVLDAIRLMTPLAPLHNPANLEGVEVSMVRRPDVPQVAVFDTAFHQSMPPHAFQYALPNKLYVDHHVRRYGFHGTSHHYVAKAAAAYLKVPLENLNLITLHLGNGASAAAILAGESIDTSMGLTPLEGLIMGTRCGDLDPSIPFYLARETGMTLTEIDDLFNRQSGLRGLCGVSDMREMLRLVDEGNVEAKLAFDMYCYRIKKYIGAYWAALGRLDVLIFTGGVGENAPRVRAGSCAGLEGMGVALDSRKNETRSGRIMEVQGERSSVKVLVVPTDEELEIARQTMACIEAGKYQAGL
ncbi:MAG: acetate kinase [Desulfobulbaceae bacterium]|nr:acetate kinase [Desulfobulbaceae bacterium]